MRNRRWPLPRVLDAESLPPDWIEKQFKAEAEVKKLLPEWLWRALGSDEYRRLDEANT